MKKFLLIILILFSFTRVNAAALLDVDSNMSVWWKSSETVRGETTLNLVKQMDRGGILNSRSETHIQISKNLTACANTATEGLDQINNSQSIGTVLLLCVYQMNYMR